LILATVNEERGIAVAVAHDLTAHASRE